MSTRSNVAFQLSPDSRVYLYRHHDGYPAVGGATLARALLWERAKHPRSPNVDLCRVVRTLLNMPQEYLSPDYELTDGVHGDIEHFYQVSMVRGAIEIHHVEGYGAGLDPRCPESTDSRAADYSIDDFAALCDCDIRRMNVRISINNSRGGIQYDEMHAIG